MTEVTFKIFRFDPDTDKSHHFDEFQISVTKGMTVLDGLYEIQNNLDPSLTFRSSCREGVCGSCAMHISGSYSLACETQIIPLKKKIITIRPLSHLPIIRDLVVDFSLFWKKYKLIKPYLIPGESAGEKERFQSPAERINLDVIVDCILCASCYSSCMLTDTDPEYIGPAALTKICRFINDGRDSDKERRLTVASDEHGVARCHTMYNCKEACPKEINPTKWIAKLKKEIVKNSYCIK